MPKNIAFLTLCALLVYSGVECKRFIEANRPYPIPGVGLRIDNHELIWAMNIGVLNIPQQPKLTRDALTSKISAAFANVELRLTRKIKSFDKAKLDPSVADITSIRFEEILDQPMDADFLLDRMFRKKQLLAGRFDPNSPYLNIDDPMGELNKSKVKNYNQGLAILTKLKTFNKTFEPNGRIPFSYVSWEGMYSQEVRYDIILTNTPIFCDDLTQQDYCLDAMLHVGLFPARGRTAMLGVGSVVSAYPQVSPDAITHAIERAIEQMIFGEDFAPEILQDWTAMALYHSGKVDQACGLLTPFRQEKTRSRAENARDQGKLAIQSICLKKS